MEQLYYIALAIVALPLLAALVIGLGNKRIPEHIAHWVACGCVGGSFLLSACVLWGFVVNKYTTLDANVYLWGQSGGLQITVGFLIDHLTALMMAVVTFVSLAVHIYTIGYMQQDPGYQRFFCYISLFTFSMLMLVMANNFAQLFFGWEAVGLVSYLLIGFWYQRDSATFAGLKAFIINRVGDLGFILGIAAILYYFNSLHYQTIFIQIPKFIVANEMIIIWPGTESLAISVICICLFIGAMAKSAQVPLHVWLPDSMEGPTPISALIHAATMVTAGVFMVARMSPLFEYSTAALSFMTVIGAITCFFMGILAVIQKDIKRIIAYSTLSQLGYMVIALGISAYSAAIFHLFTHAFFKALLFLGAGSVIMALHHEQNILKMGGLSKYMPVTTAAMLVGSLALMGFPGTSGFYSKDLIIELASKSQIPGASIAYVAALISVFITTLYSLRLLYLVFFGNERPDTNAHVSHIDEPGKTILIPLILLAIPTIAVGGIMINGMLHGFLQKSLFVLAKHNVMQQFTQESFHGALSMFLHGFISLPFLFVILGTFTAWLCYIKYPSLPQVLQRDTTLLVKLLQAKYGFDALYERILMPLTRGIGGYFWRIGDMLLIDKLIVNGTAHGIGRTAVILQKLQTGYLYHYIFIIIAGLLALLLGIMYL